MRCLSFGGCYGDGQVIGFFNARLTVTVVSGSGTAGSVTKRLRAGLVIFDYDLDHVVLRPQGP